MLDPFATLLRDYEWVHLTLGLIGNVCFVVGSAFFLYETLKIEGTWLFIIGSSGMLIGAVGSAVVKLTWRMSPTERRRAQQES